MCLSTLFAFLSTGTTSKRTVNLPEHTAKVDDKSSTFTTTTNICSMAHLGYSWLTERYQTPKIFTEVDNAV
jgi:hypothetical protein